MKTLLATVLVLFSLGCPAQEDPLEHLTDIELCQYKINEAQMFTTISTQAAQERDYEYAFQFIREAYMHLIGAKTLCEGEYLETANHYTDEWQEIRSQITCSYHAFNAQNHIQITKDILTENQYNYKDSLNESRQALYFLNEGLKWCTLDEEQLAIIENFWTNITNFIKVTEELMGLNIE